MHVRAALRNGLTPRRDQGGAAADRGLLRRSRRERRLRDRPGACSREEGAGMTRAVLLSAVRTPIGRHGGDARRRCAPDDLAAHRDRRGRRARRRASRARSRTSTSAAPTRPARTTATSRAWPRCSPACRESVAGVTRQPALRLGAGRRSSAACHAVLAGDGDLFVAGGVESMSRAPLVTAKPDRRSRAATARSTTRRSAGASPTRAMEELFPLESMGETGENVAERWGVSPRGPGCVRAALAARWAEAQAAGRFADELSRVAGVDGRRAPAAGHDRRGAREAAAGVPAPAAPSRRATRAASTTARRRS